jgi:uncharacterized membrane protein required for colicin V production
MTLDFLFILPLIVFAVLGFRDGMVRKLVAIASVIAAMFIAQTFQYDLGKVLRSELNVDPASAPVQAYYLIFIGIILMQSLLYRLLAKGYKIGGIADRIIGSALGLFQGMLIFSVILVMFSLQGIPSKKVSRESRLYGVLISIAPRITDIATTALPEVKESFKELTAPSQQQEMGKDEKYLRDFEKEIKSSNRQVDSVAKAATKKLQ